MSHFTLLILLALGHLIVDMHAGGLPVLLPVLKESYALTYTQIGGLVLLSQITSSIIQPLFGLFSDRLNVRWIMPISLGISTLGLAAVGLANQYAMVVVGVVVMGLGLAAYHPEASKVAHFVGGHRKGSAMSVFALGGNVGLALGPLVMAVGLSLAGLRGALIYVPLTAIVALLFQASLPKLYAGWDRNNDERKADVRPSEASVAKTEPSPPTRKRAATFRTLSTLLLAITLRSCAHTALITFIPLYYSTLHGNPASYSSALLTLFLVAGAIGTALGGPASDRLGARRVIVWSFLTSAPILIVLPLVTTGMAPFVIAILAGLTLVSSFAVTTVLGQVLLPSRVGLASGLTLGFSVGTGGLGVTALGFIADHLGLTTAMFSIAVLAGLGVLVSLKLPRDESAAPSVPSAQSSHSI